MKKFIRSIINLLGIDISRISNAQRFRLEIETRSSQSKHRSNATIKITSPDLGHVLLPTGSTEANYLYNEIFLKRIYDFEDDGDELTIVDAGANVGFASLFWMRRFPHAHIIAIEADDFLADLCSKNLSAQTNERITVINKALWSHCNGVDFGRGGMTKGHVDHSGTSSNIKSVPSISLDKVLENIAVVDFLKMDIEGSEYSILQTPPQSLHKCKRLFIEFHISDRHEPMFDAIKQLTQIGFTLQYLSSPEIASPLCSNRRYFGNFSGVVNTYWIHNSS